MKLESFFGEKMAMPLGSLTGQKHSKKSSVTCMQGPVYKDELPKRISRLQREANNVG